MNPQYPAVAERAAYRCEYCHAPEIVFNFPFEVEHVLPQAHGGSDDLDNLALACPRCCLRGAVEAPGSRAASGGSAGPCIALSGTPRQDSILRHAV